MLLPQNTLVLLEDQTLNLFSADYKICDVKLPSEFVERQENIIKQRRLALQMVPTTLFPYLFLLLQSPRIDAPLDMFFDGDDSEFFWSPIKPPRPFPSSQTPVPVNNESFDMSMDMSTSTPDKENNIAPTGFNLRSLQATPYKSPQSIRGKSP